MLGVAIVGLGWWGRTIFSALQGHRSLRVVRVVDPDPASRDVARSFGVSHSARLDDALADSAVHAVVLCTPHSLHCEQATAAASAGRHVFCEKPLAMNRREALRIVNAVENNRVCLAVGHEKRFEPPIVEAMRLLRSGELGRPLQVEANFSQDKFLAMPRDNWRLSEREAPAGPMTATGVHLLDLAVGVFGAADRVLACVDQLGSNLANGDTLAALVSFRGGGNALISAMLATPFVGRFAIYGSTGWVEVRDKTHPEAPEGWTLTVCLRGQPARTIEYPPVSAVLLNLEAFADAIAGTRPYPVPHRQMLENICALEAIFRSAKNRTIETVEQADPAHG